jgi:hypothetical protein
MLKFESIGYKAPFQFAGLFELPSSSLLEQNPAAYNNAMRDMPCPVGSCAYCGTGIKYNYIVKDADDRKFAVGCECINKIDQKMYDAAKRAKRDLMISKLAAKKAAATRARHEEERLRNGGLTDAEVEKKKNEEAYNVKKAAFVEIHKDLFDSVQETGNPFGLHVLESVMEWLSVSEKQLAILQRIVNDHIRAKNALNEYAGSIGDKMISVLTVEKEFLIEGYYGPTWIILLSDELGRSFKYFGTSKAIPDVGKSVQLKFTVKSHDEYNGVKQTQINRPSVAK